MPEGEAFRLLQILEDNGILWTVNRGDEILYLELLSSARGGVNLSILLSVWAGAIAPLCIVY